MVVSWAAIGRCDVRVADDDDVVDCDCCSSLVDTDDKDVAAAAAAWTAADRTSLDSSAGDVGDCGTGSASVIGAVECLKTGDDIDADGAAKLRVI